MSQNEMWKWENQDKQYQATRLKLVSTNYNNMVEHKGIGVNEVNVDGFSFYGPGKSTDNSKPWHYYKTIEQSMEGTTSYYGSAWDNDLVVIGYIACPFILRGGRN